MLKYFSCMVLLVLLYDFLLKESIKCSVWLITEDGSCRRENIQCDYIRSGKHEVWKFLTKYGLTLTESYKFYDEGVNK